MVVVGPAVAAGDTGPAAEPSRPSVGLRRLAHRYGWLVAAGGIACAVLVCAASFISGADPMWNSAALSPSPTGPTSLSPSPSRSAAPRAAAVPAARTPSPTRASTSASVQRPSPARTRSREPVLLGPRDAGDLYAMLNDHCRGVYGDRARAWPRRWRGSAEDNWVCRAPGQPERAIDVSAACVRRYGAGAHASYTDRADATSWRCYGR